MCARVHICVCVCACVCVCERGAHRHPYRHVPQGLGGSSSSSPHIHSCQGSCTSACTRTHVRECAVNQELTRSTYTQNGSGVYICLWNVQSIRSSPEAHTLRIGQGCTYAYGMCSQSGAHQKHTHSE